MSQSSSRPKWDPDDAAAFRAFLKSSTGTRFSQYLQWAKPTSHVESPDAISVSLTLGRVQGYDELLADLNDLQRGLDRPSNKLTTD